MSVAEPGPSPAAPAATVAVLRDARAGVEVLLLRRNPTASFGGMWVFPGGRVDPQDRAGMGEVGGQTDDGAPELVGARRAAVRETEEEAGIRLDEEVLVPLSWWMPPPEAPRRFATWFFVAPVDTGTGVRVHRAEVDDHVWCRPDEAMARRDRGEIVLAPPTWMTLRWLRAHPDVAAALGAAQGRSPERFVVRLVLDDQGHPVASLYEGDVAYDDGDLARPGPRRRLLSGRGEWRFEEHR